MAHPTRYNRSRPYEIGMGLSPVTFSLPEAELVKYLAQIGLEEVRITARFDCFRATSKERTARKYGVQV